MGKELPDRVLGVSLAGDVIFRELSVNPLVFFFSRDQHLSALSLALSRALPRLHPALPFDPVRGTLSGILSGVPTTSDVAAFGALRKRRQTGFVPCTCRISDIKFVEGPGIEFRPGQSMRISREISWSSLTSIVIIYIRIFELFVHKNSPNLSRFNFSGNWNPEIFLKAQILCEDKNLPLSHKNIRVSRERMFVRG